MTLLATLKRLTVSRFPHDTPPYRTRSEAQKIDDNFAAIADFLDNIVADAGIVVGSENTNVRAITVQLKNRAGGDIASVQTVLAGVFGDANGTSFSSGGSTGLAIGTDGALLALVAKKLFLLTCEADGDIDLTWTDTGTDAAYLGIILPNGKIVMSGAMTNT